MTDTEFESKFLQACKKYGVSIDSSSQMELHCFDVDLIEKDKEYLSDKQCLIWLGSNQNGKEYNVIRNQVYLAHGDTKVFQPIKLTFEEVYEIWEEYEKGISVLEIWKNNKFHFGVAVEYKEVSWVIWTLQHGKWNYVLNYLKEDTYPFDFKKYLRRY